MTRSVPLIGPAAEARRLDNGITVLMEPLPYVRSASIGVWIRAGSGNEVPAEAGISHLLEHLFFKGTSRRSAFEISEAIESRGGQMNAFTSRDYTCLYVRALDLHVDSAVDVLIDVLRDSQYFDFEKERNVILEEIASIEDVPDDYVHDLFTERLWPHHPLGAPVAGSEESVARLTTEDVARYFGQWYRPSEIIVSAVGRFDEDALFDQLAAGFGDWPLGETPTRPDAPAPARCTEHIDRDITQSHLVIGFPGPTVTDPERFAYDLLANVLGGGSTSRLFDRIREQEGLAYSIYSFHSVYRVAGMMGLYAAVAPENLGQTLSLVSEELRRLRLEEVPEREIQSNRDQIEGGLLMALESTFSRMARMAKSYMYHGRIVTTEELCAAIDAVTAADLQRVAERVFRPENAVSVVLGPRPAGVAVEPAL
jgi:predicted Zn-dependent peptidase